MTRENRLIVSGILTIGLLVVSGIATRDRATWAMEVSPVLIALPILAFTYRRFPLTSLLYSLIFLHAVVLIVGGAYTYARVPLGFWIQDVFSLARNPYDKIGHFMQGLVPALVTREIPLRGGFVPHGKMVAFLALCVAMAVSAWYELIEWCAALALGQGAYEFLGTQGDVWDTQADMVLAFLGAMAGLTMFARAQDRQIADLEREK